jgi:hypothetical protein
VEPSHQGFSYILPPRSSAVTVDDEHVVAGIAPPGSSRVLVHLNEGRFFDALITTGAGFAAPVWSALLFDDADGRVDYYTAFDGKGQEIARLKA